MALLERLRRSASLSSPPRWLFESFGGGGKSVSVRQALGVPAVYSATAMISGDVAQTPLIVYREERGEKVRARGSNAWRLLHEQPNPEMSADEWLECVMNHLLLWGNSVSFKVHNGFGVRELWPISPSRCSFGRVDGVKYTFIDGQPFTDDDVLHIRGMSDDGFLGWSPIQLQRRLLGNALLQDEFLGDFMGNGGRPAYVLTHPQKLSDAAAARVKEAWDHVKRGGSTVLEEDVKVQQLTMPLTDAEFLSQRKFSDTQIAQMFLLPASKLGADSGKSMRYENVEGAQIEYSTGTLSRWYSRIEKSIKRDGAICPGSLHPEFLAEALLRADSKVRSEVYKSGLESKWLTVDEVRQRENLPPLLGGK